MRFRCLARLVVLLAILFHPAFSFAQSNATDGALEGFIQDATASTVPNATVIATNLRTGGVSSATTGTDGYYRFALLQVGEYELLVTAPGFGEYRQTGIRLSAGQKARVDIGLELGGAAETVTVKADAAIAVSSQAATGEVLPEEAVRTLPITSRNVYNFHLLGPGVKGRPSTGFGTTSFYVGGAQRMQWYMDGIDNTSRNGGRQIRLVITTPENVEEMQLMTGNYSAEFGRAAGGVINVITRSGGNQFNGSITAMDRPSSIISKSPLAATKVKQTWSMFDANLSGPLVRDRIFIFGNYEYNPYTAQNPVTITPANLAALKLPVEELKDMGGETFHTPSAKVSFKANARNSGFFRFNRFTNRQPGNASGLSSLSRGNIYKDRMNGFGGQLATILGQSLLNELRGGLNIRNTWNTPPCVGADEGRLVNVAGVANFGCQLGAASTSTEQSFELLDNVTRTMGAHTWKSGVNFQTVRNAPTSGQPATFSFNGLAAANGRPAVSALDQYLRTLAGDVDPATGRPYTYTQLAQNIGDPSVQLRFNFVNVFTQDEWRVNQNLTLNFGLRYEVIMYPTLDANAPYPQSREIATDTNNFAPRVGFNWAPGSDQKTAIRGGYGIYYDNPGLNLATGAAQTSTRLLSYQVQGGAAGAPVYPRTLNAADPSFSVVPSITAFDPDFETMYAHNASIQMTRELARNVALSVGYSYWAHRNGPYTHDVNLAAPVSYLADGRPVYAGAANRPDTRFRAINMVSSGAEGTYHGLDLSLRRRFDNGLQFTFNYGWSRARANGNLEGGTVTDPSNVDFDWGPSNFDQPHTVSGQWSYTPKLSTGATWLNGMQFSSTTFYGSGLPFTPASGVDLNNDLVLNDVIVGSTRNSARLPDFFQTDLRVARRFNFGTTRKAVEVLVESENLFNRLNATAVVTNATAADFGRVTATRPGRYVQLGARFFF